MGSTTWRGGTSGPSQEEVKSEIESSYAPIFEELNRRIGLLPQQKSDYEQQVANLSENQMAGIQTAKETSLSALGREETSQKAQSAGTLRDLAENVRNLLSSAANVWGGSSAVTAASAGIGKQATKERGKVLSARDTALSNLQSKATDVEKEYDTQVKNIDTWKANQLISVRDQIQQMEDSIRGQMATASSEKAQALSNLVQQAYTAAQNRLSALDQMVTQYKQNMDTWKVQNQDWLNNQIELIKVQAQYQTPTPYNPTLSTITGGGFQQPISGVTYGTQAGTSEEDLWKQIQNAYLSQASKLF